MAVVPEGAVRAPSNGIEADVVNLRRSHACDKENRRRMVVGTGRLYPTQTSETSFQQTMRHRRRSTSAVADRSRRPAEVQK